LGRHGNNNPRTTKAASRFVFEHSEVWQANFLK